MNHFHYPQSKKNSIEGFRFKICRNIAFVSNVAVSKSLAPTIARNVKIALFGWTITALGWEIVWESTIINIFGFFCFMPQ